ncbi:MAG: LUD domain-containing protein, partial [Desulfobacterales bacterium]|nr:LUD domain-containing protein [Desulfobacterales bacterium]
TKFLDNIRKALCVDGKKARPDLFCRQPDEGSMIILDRISGRPHSSRLQLLEKMIDAAKSVNLNVIPVKTLPEAAQEIIKLACEKKPEWGDEKSIVLWKHPLIEEMNIGGFLQERDITVIFSNRPDAGNTGRDRLIKESAMSFIGITSADYCIAETGTLVLKTAPGNERSVSLLPSIHVAVIKLEQVIADFKELYTLLDKDLKDSSEGIENGMTFITGPSKTADIEATMVHGAHGPREVYIYVVTGD